MGKLILHKFYTLLIYISKKILFPIQDNIDFLPSTKLQKKDGVNYILRYSNSNVRDFIHQIKFSKNKKYFEYIGKELSHYLPTNTDIFILPVPQTKSRIRERGYDVTHCIVKEIQKHINIQYSHGILINIRKDVQSQIKDREKRITSVADTIKILGDVKGKKFIIIDDVFTTGSTIREIKKIIEERGGEVVDCFCVAH